jgi:hypothetical protein
MSPEEEHGSPTYEREGKFHDRSPKIRYLGTGVVDIKSTCII